MPTPPLRGFQWLGMRGDIWGELSWNIKALTHSLRLELPGNQHTPLRSLETAECQHTHSNISQDCVLVSTERYEVFYSSPDVLFYVAHTSWPTETTQRAKKPNLSLCQNGAVVLLRCQTHPHAALILIQGTEGEILHVFLWQKPKLAIKEVFQAPL